MVLNFLKAQVPRVFLMICLSLVIPNCTLQHLITYLCFRYQINLVLVQNDNANFHTPSEQCSLYFKSLCCKNFKFCVVLIEVHFLKVTAVNKQVFSASFPEMRLALMEFPETYSP